VFVKPLQPDARVRLSRPILDPSYRTEGTKIMLSADHMRSLPRFFAEIPDPRRTQGRRHRLPSDCSRGSLVRDARVQSHLGLGQ
jgi:hypothetical protein